FRAGLAEKIEASLEKVRYRYLIPEPDDNTQRAARAQLEQLTQRHPGRVEYGCFKRDVFEKQATADYVIGQPDACDTSDLKVFVRIPIADAETEYWFDTEERA